MGHRQHTGENQLLPARCSDVCFQPRPWLGWLCRGDRRGGGAWGGTGRQAAAGVPLNRPQEGHSRGASPSAPLAPAGCQATRPGGASGGRDRDQGRVRGCAGTGAAEQRGSGDLPRGGTNKQGVEGKHRLTGEQAGLKEKSPGRYADSRLKLAKCFFRGNTTPGASWHLLADSHCSSVVPVTETGERRLSPGPAAKRQKISAWHQSPSCPKTR